MVGVAACLPTGKDLPALATPQACRVGEPRLDFGVAGLEPATSSSRTMRASQLRYSPSDLNKLVVTFYPAE